MAESTTTTTRPKRADIQGLRALAVGLVVLAHYDVPGFAGGFIGVDVFFVISGYLITGLLLREGEREGRISLTGFYSRRARRILPAATLVLVATVAATAIWEATAELESAITDALWAAFFLANVHLANVGANYSDGEDPSLVQHYWSLAVEEQFYLVWPVLFIVLVATRSSRRGMFAVVTAVWSASLAWSVWSTGNSEITAYFSSPARAYELVTGALVAVAAPLLSRLRPSLRTPVAVLGLAAVVLSAIAYDLGTPFPSGYALVPALGTAVVLAAGTGTDTPPVSLLSLQPFQHIGDLSYSLYLWHWPVLLFGGRHVDGWVGTAMLVVLAVVLAELTYRFVEMPFHYGRVPKMKTRFALTLWPASIAVVLGATSVASSYGDAMLDKSRDQAAAYYEEHPDAVKKPSGLNVKKEILESIQLADRGAPVPPKLRNGDNLSDDVWQAEFDCYAGFEDESAKVCPLGEVGADKTVVLLGDSHAGMWMFALDKLGKARGFEVVPLVKFGCAPYDVPQTFRGDDFPSCPAFRDWSRGQVEKIAPDALVIGHRGLNYIEPEDDRSPEDAWSQGVSETVGAYTDLVPEVKVLGDVAKLPWMPGSCITDAKATMRTCTAPAEGSEVESNALTEAAIKGTGADFVPAIDLVCQRGRCPAVVGDTVTYRDNTHISITWSRVVARELGRMLDLKLQGSPPAEG